MPTHQIKFLESFNWVRSLRRLTVAVAFLVFISYFFQISTVTTFGQEKVASKQVLLLHAQDQFLPANIVMDKTLYSALKSDQTLSINIYSEYLEKVRFDSDLIQKETIDLLHSKYDKLALDLIIITDDLSWDFYQANGKEVFKGIPVVLCGITDGKLKVSDLGENITGNYKKLDIKADIETILSVQPDTKQIEIIVGTSKQDAYYENITRQVFIDFNGKFKTEYLTGLGIEDVQKKISELPPKTVILYVSMYMDGKGQGFNPRDVIPLLKKTANAPIYGVSDTYLGYGILGGNLLSFTDLSQNAAEIAIKVLNGAKPSDIPIQVLKNKNYFDWNEMQLWGIKEGQLPKGSVIVNKVPGIWDLYKARIILAICFLGLLLIIVFVLLIQLYLKKKAQAELLIVNKSLNESEEKFRYLFEHSVVGQSFTQPSGKMDVNNAMSAMLGYTADELKGKPWQEITHPDDFKKTQQEIDTLLSGEKASIGFIKRYIKKDGSIIWVDVLSSMRRDSDGEPLYLMTSIIDITEQKKNEEELIYLSYNDKLTGLYNRIYFDTELKRMDSEENLPISIIMCDVNGLKLINDSFGHSAGDEVLIKIAKIIKECCDKEEVVARLGGDEFVVLLPQTNLQDANKIIDTIKKMLLDEKVVGLNINASFGLDTKENSEQSIVETLQNSENYMYRHKLYEQASTKSDTINIIIKTLFEKSHRESLHSERVSEYCEKIAMALKLNKDEINKIKIAGLVHDIGKIGIREDILNKPGKLNEEEWKEMKKHPEASWRILSSSLEYSEIARYIYEHHEKLDGSGYPRGLKGDEISVEARIIAIADAYDAMTSDRTYRKGLNINEAINEMKKYSGTQFDPDIVNIFIEKLAS